MKIPTDKVEELKKFCLDFYSADIIEQVNPKDEFFRFVGEGIVFIVVPFSTTIASIICNDKEFLKEFSQLYGQYSRKLRQEKLEAVTSDKTAGEKNGDDSTKTSSS